MQELIAHQTSINHQLARYGVKFGLYKNGEFKERLFPFDPLPRIISAAEFAVLNKGLTQRVTALNLFLKDLYGEKNYPRWRCAHDNAIVLRETLSIETLAYVQMAAAAIQLAAESTAPAVELQWVLDDIMAFRGSCEENIESENSRNIIKSGASLERLDLYLRLGYPREVCLRELNHLAKGEGTTHAWAEVYYNGAWYGFDPTRNCRTDAGYLRFAAGRDSADCPVEQGCFIGPAK